MPRNLSVVRLIVFLIPVLTFSACSKNYGCRDDEAINFDPWAEKSDYSCLYVLKIGFYIRSWDADSLADLGCDFYHLFLDGQYIGSDSVSNFVPDNKSPYSYTNIFFQDTIGSQEKFAEISLTDIDSALIKKYTMRLRYDAEFEQFQMYK